MTTHVSCFWGSWLNPSQLGNRAQRCRQLSPESSRFARHHLMRSEGAHDLQKTNIVCCFSICPSNRYKDNARCSGDVLIAAPCSRHGTVWDSEGDIHFVKIYCTFHFGFAIGFKSALSLLLW
jgi:hypothetical protein